MSCLKKSCKFNIRSFGVDDVTKVILNGRDRTQLNWKQISIPEILDIPLEKPDIESLDQIFVNLDLTNAKLIETPYAYEVYDRLVTILEITSIENIINLVQALTIQPIIDAVDSILAIADLPAIPEVAALQAALAAVVAAFDTVTDITADIVTILNGTCIIASVLLAAVQLLLAAVNALFLTLVL